MGGGGENRKCSSSRARGLNKQQPSFRGSLVCQSLLCFAFLSFFFLHFTQANMGGFQPDFPGSRGTGLTAVCFSSICVCVCVGMWVCVCMKCILGAPISSWSVSSDRKPASLSLSLCLSVRSLSSVQLGKHGTQRNGRGTDWSHDGGREAHNDFIQPNKWHTRIGLVIKVDPKQANNARRRGRWLSLYGRTAHHLITIWAHRAHGY